MFFVKLKLSFSHCMVVFSAATGIDQLSFKIFFCIFRDLLHPLFSLTMHMPFFMMLL